MEPTMKRRLAMAAKNIVALFAIAVVFYLSIWITAHEIGVRTATLREQHMQST